jgi:PAS domain S-box-containing protein
MFEFFRKLFSTDFMPHGICYFWNPIIVWLNVISDAVIAASYFTIPVFLFLVAGNRKDFKFHWGFLAFSAFILACATTHLMDIWTIWHAMYRLDSVMKAAAAVISVTTAALLFPLIPSLFHLCSPVQLALANEILASEVELRKRMATVLERQAGLLELAHDAIMVRDLDGRIEFWNRGAENLYGWSKQVAEGRIKHELLKTVFPEPLEEIRRKLIETGYWEGELQHTKRDGSTIIVSSPWVLRGVDGRIEVLEINRDITQQKRFEKALLEKNVELEKANQAKDRFLASMSHELRTPLNAIIGFTGTLLMRLPGPLKPDQEKQLRIVQASGRHLLSLINDLLDLAKIESGKIELRRELVNCRDVLNEIANYLRPMAESKEIVLSIDAPSKELLVETDRRALHQILLNLANNAVKFTDQGFVQLRVREKASGSGAVVEFAVIDTGTGIRAEDQDKLFQAFSQLDASSDTCYQGTGLGLHLSQKLAELLAGRITFYSDFGKGSTFKLTLA